MRRPLPGEMLLDGRSQRRVASQFGSSVPSFRNVSSPPRVHGQVLARAPRTSSRLAVERCQPNRRAISPEPDPAYAIASIRARSSSTNTVP